MCLHFLKTLFMTTMGVRIHQQDLSSEDGYDDWCVTLSVLFHVVMVSSHVHFICMHEQHVTD